MKKYTSLMNFVILLGIALLGYLLYKRIYPAKIENFGFLRRMASAAANSSTGQSILSSAATRCKSECVTQGNRLRANAQARAASDPRLSSLSQTSEGQSLMSESTLGNGISACQSACDAARSKVGTI